MSTLLLDIGNTRTKAAVTNGDAFTLIENANHSNKHTWNTIIKKHHLTHYFISNVNIKQHSIITCIHSMLKPIPFNNKVVFPFTNKYKNKSLGHDRISMAAAAATTFKNKNVLIISCGTCITYDFVNDRSEYLGGAISLGLRMRYQALHDYTANLPLLTTPKFTDITGNTTLDSIHSGVLQGIIAEINFQIKHYKAAYPKLHVILTGGDARYFEPHLNYKIFARENFVLQGMHRILQLNYPHFV